MNEEFWLFLGSAMILVSGIALLSQRFGSRTARILERFKYFLPGGFFVFALQRLLSNDLVGAVFLAGCACVMAVAQAYWKRGPGSRSTSA